MLRKLEKSADLDFTLLFLFLWTCANRFSCFFVFFCAGLVGLAISYALSVTDRLSGMVTSFTETEKQMVSVERAVQYIEDVPSEVSPRGTVRVHLKFLLLQVIFSG